MIDWVELILANPWSLALVYYVLKQIARATISLIVGTSADIWDSLHQVGPDLCFMAFTLFAVAVIDRSSSLYKLSSDPPAFVMLFTIFFWLSYGLAYLLYRRQKQLGKTENPAIAGKQLSRVVCVLVKSIMLFIALVLGAYAYSQALVLWLRP